MKKTIEETLKFLPTNVDELERRAIFSTALQGEWATEPWFKKTKNGAVKYYSWNDGGGQSYGLWLGNHDTALILVFDHECAFNFYAEDGKHLQETFYTGVPFDFFPLFTNQPETYEHLNVTNSEGNEIYAASGVIWLEDRKWHASEDYKTLAAENQDDGGLKYCLKPLTFNFLDTMDEYVTFLIKEPSHEEQKPLIEKLTADYKKGK